MFHENGMKKFMLEKSMEVPMKVSYSTAEGD
jgi:hypothetical protein